MAGMDRQYTTVLTIAFETFAESGDTTMDRIRQEGPHGQLIHVLKGGTRITLVVRPLTPHSVGNPMEHCARRPL